MRAAAATCSSTKCRRRRDYNSLSDQELFGDLASRYPGQFVIGRDLDIY